MKRGEARVGCLDHSLRKNMFFVRFVQVTWYGGIIPGFFRFGLVPPRNCILFRVLTVPSKNIVESQVEGWQIVECEPGKLDAILKKRVGIGCVNQRGTVLQAFGSGLYGVTLKAGIFLNPYVAKKAVEDRFETARRPSHFKHVLARRKSPLLDVEKNTTKMARRANRRRSKGGMLIR